MKLRAPTLSDIDDILLWENDPKVQSHSSEPRNYTRSQIEEFINRNDNLVEHGQQRFMIIHNDKTVGCVDLYDFNAAQRVAYVGILVYHNPQHGLGLQALMEVEKYVASVYHLQELRAEIPRENIAGLKVFAKAGYLPLRDNIYTKRTL